MALFHRHSLVVLDRGFYDFQFFADLSAQGTHFITRLKNNAKIEMLYQLTITATLKDRIV